MKSHVGNSKWIFLKVSVLLNEKFKFFAQKSLPHNLVGKQMISNISYFDIKSVTWSTCSDHIFYELLGNSSSLYETSYTSPWILNLVMKLYVTTTFLYHSLMANSIQYWQYVIFVSKIEQITHITHVFLP